MKTAVAAVPVFVIAWASGVIGRPDALGLVLLAAIAGTAIVASVVRWRAVMRARHPGVRVVEEEGERFMERIEAETQDLEAFTRRLEAELERDRQWIAQMDADYERLAAESAALLAQHKADDQVGERRDDERV